MSAQRPHRPPRSAGAVLEADSELRVFRVVRVQRVFRVRLRGPMRRGIQVRLRELRELRDNRRGRRGTRGTRGPERSREGRGAGKVKREAGKRLAECMRIGLLEMHRARLSSSARSHAPAALASPSFSTRYTLAHPSAHRCHRHQTAPTARCCSRSRSRHTPGAEPDSGLVEHLRARTSHCVPSRRPDLPMMAQTMVQTMAPRSRRSSFPPRALHSARGRST